jgi:hypothetical protein
VQEERQVMNDNCVSYRTLKLQIPESPMRAHFVKARIRVHVYPDGSHALFHGPRCIGRYDQNGAIRDAKNAPLKPARRRAPVDGMDKPPACPPRPQEQKQKKRTNHVLPKPDKLIRYRQAAIDRPLSTGRYQQVSVADDMSGLCSSVNLDRFIRPSLSMGGL